MSFLWAAILLLTPTLHSQLLQRSLIESSFDKIQTRIEQDFSKGVARQEAERVLRSYYNTFPTLITDTQLIKEVTKSTYNRDSSFQQLVTMQYAPNQLEQRALRYVWAILKDISTRCEEPAIFSLIDFLEDTMQHTQWLGVDTHSYMADISLSNAIDNLDIEQIQQILLTYYLQAGQNYLQLTEAKRALEFKLAYSVELYLDDLKQDKEMNLKSFIIIPALIAEGISFLHEAIRNLKNN